MSLEFRYLGTLDVVRAGEPVDIGSPRQKAVLARLLIARGDVVATDRLLDDLWPEHDPDRARKALHVYVSRLRKAFGIDDHLQRHHPGYRLVVQPTDCDAARFEQLASEGRRAADRLDHQGASERLRAALALWRGPALTEFRHEPFAQAEAARLEELRLAVLEQRLWSDLELGAGHLIEELEHLVRAHPLRETFCEQLMLALYRGGQQAEALRVYQSTRRRLADELGLRPGPALRRMEERILGQDPSIVTAPHPSAEPEPEPDELGWHRTSFVGRAAELERGGELLDRSRLVTLTGPPGSGKTRLAQRLAGQRRTEFRHGVRVVSLAAVSDPRLVGSEIAKTLGLRSSERETLLDAVKAFLRDRELLLVLDNLEQISAAGPQVGELIDASPGLTVIATSRSPLNLSGEQEFPVPPLTVPPVDEPPDLDRLVGFEAVELFAARARAVRPDFVIDGRNAAAVAEITARLGGLPLAIELAAARINVLTPHDLLKRLDRSLLVLTGGPTDVDHRHRTMRAAIAWSHELLDEADQALFRRLGVFRGGFTIEAAAAVADLPDDQVLDGVGSLLSNSLLHRVIDVGEARFAMLELIGEFAADELVAAGEDPVVAHRHATYFAAVADDIEPMLSQQELGRGVARLSADADNIRAALGYAIRAREPDLGLGLASSVWRYWQSSGHLVEGRDWLDRLLADPSASEDARAHGLAALAGIEYWQGDYEEALARYHEALDLFQAIGDRFNQADVLCSMSLTALWLQDIDRGEALAARSRALVESLGSRREEGKVLMSEATALWWRGDHEASHRLWTESLAIAIEFGDRQLALTQQLGLAALTYLLGDRGSAVARLIDSIDEAVLLQNDHILVWLLDLDAALCAGQEPAQAVRLAGAAAALRAEAGGGISVDALGIDSARTVAAGVLTPAELDDAWRQGQAMSLAQAIDAARALGQWAMPTER